MIKRGALFIGWAFVGMVFSYGALYAFTPFGLAIIGGCIWVGIALQAAGGGSRLEAIGLLAGPGLFCVLVAQRRGGRLRVGDRGRRVRGHRARDVRARGPRPLRAQRLAL